MRVRVQADAELDGRCAGCNEQRLKSTLALRPMPVLQVLEDPEVLAGWPRTPGRVLVSQDRRTMPAHFAQYVKRTKFRSNCCEATPIAPAIEELVLIWAASDAEVWINRLAWIPL